MATAVVTTSEDRTPPQRFVLRGMDWPSYRKIAEGLNGRHIRLTYDRGTLELMTISTLHGTLSRLLFQLVMVLTEETGLPRRSCGDMTCDREDLERGLEPDECFYIANEPRVRGREQIDLATDPPPDLVVEVDISRSSQRRLAVYAALGVPEAWRFDGQDLTIHQGGPGGQFVIVERSVQFPFVTPADLARFLNLRTQTDENSLIRAFREWVRDQLARQQP